MPSLEAKQQKIITLLSDFGSKDSYVAAMKARIFSITASTAVEIVDISHDVPPYQIAAAAYLLESCWQTFPKGTIHVAVVDPGVGSSRRPLLIEAADHYFIGPDNGLFGFLKSSKSLNLFDLSATTLPLGNISTTFHGRDLFAPIAAHLAIGAPLDSLGKPAAAASLREISSLNVAKVGSCVQGITIHVDRFGNLVTNIEAAELGHGAWRVSLVRGEEKKLVGKLSRTFSDVPKGGAVAYVGSSNRLEIAINQGSAAAHFGVSATEPTVVEATPCD